MRRATDWMAIGIALAAFGVSYATQVRLAGAHGFTLLEALAWPAIADAAALCMILRLHYGAVRRGWYTAEAWGVFTLAAGIMVGANAIADQQDPLGALMHGCVPFVAMAVWHVIIHGRPVTGPVTAAAKRQQEYRQRRNANVTDHNAGEVERNAA